MAGTADDIICAKALKRTPSDSPRWDSAMRGEHAHAARIALGPSGVQKAGGGDRSDSSQPASSAQSEKSSGSKLRERGRLLLQDKIGDEETAAWVTAFLLREHEHEFPRAVRLVVKAVAAAGTAVPHAAGRVKALEAFVKATLAPSTGSARPSRSALQPHVLVAQLQPQRIEPPMAQDADRFAMLVGGVFSSDECKRLITRAEAAGFRDATMSVTGGASVLRRDIRDNERCILTDAALAATLWERLRARGAFPERLEDGALRAVRLNEKLRFYRYECGQSFTKHMDDAYTAESGQASRLTVLLYLNGGFGGGATRLCTWEEPVERAVEVQPTAGAAFVFDHKLLHSGTPCVSGRKYVMRSDVLYERVSTCT